MTHYAEELLGYAVALFACYGVFVRVGMGRATVSLLFLGLGLATALSVMMLDSTLYHDLPPSIMGVVISCVFGFATGWGAFELLLRTGLPAALLGNGVR